MSFKMKADDFALLAKYVDAKAKGCDLDFELNQNMHRMEVKLNNALGDSVVITFFKDENGSFPKITKTERLGDAI